MSLAWTEEEEEEGWIFLPINTTLAQGIKSSHEPTSFCKRFSYGSASSPSPSPSPLTLPLGRLLPFVDIHGRVGAAMKMVKPISPLLLLLLMSDGEEDEDEDEDDVRMM